MKTMLSLNRLRVALVGAVLATLLGATSGCQVQYGGQTLPSPYYLTDDVQYYAPDSEFKLSREAAALKDYQADLQAEGL